MIKYVRYKMSHDLETTCLKITPPVLLQSFKDEFDLPTDGQEPLTLAEPGQVLLPCEEKDPLPPKMQTNINLGVEKLLHMMRWSHPDILNATWELSCHL